MRCGGAGVWGRSQARGIGVEGGQDAAFPVVAQVDAQVDEGEGGVAS